MPVVFVYGTLTDPDRARTVLGGRVRYEGPATLAGLRRVEGEYPTLAPPEGLGDPSTGTEPGDDGPRGQDGDLPTVPGRLLWTDDLAALDDYERVDRGLYVRVTVPRVADGTVETYVGDPERLGLGGCVDWPGEDPFDDRVRQTVEDLTVEVRAHG